MSKALTEALQATKTSTQPTTMLIMAVHQGVYSSKQLVTIITQLDKLLCFKERNLLDAIAFSHLVSNPPLSNPHDVNLLNKIASPIITPTEARQIDLLQTAAYMLVTHTMNDVKNGWDEFFQLMKQHNLSKDSLKLIAKIATHFLNKHPTHEMTLYLQGFLYLHGYGVEKNTHKGLKLLANSKHKRAYVYLGLEAGKQENYQQALAYFQQANKMGSPAAAANIGRMYEEGLGVDKDLEQAKKWYEKAVQRKEISGHIALARFHKKSGSPHYSYTLSLKNYFLVLYHSSSKQEARKHFNNITSMRVLRSSPNYQHYQLYHQLAQAIVADNIRTTNSLIAKKPQALYDLLNEILDSNLRHNPRLLRAFKLCEDHLSQEAKANINYHLAKALEMPSDINYQFYSAAKLQKLFHYYQLATQSTEPKRAKEAIFKASCIAYHYTHVIGWDKAFDFLKEVKDKDWTAKNYYRFFVKGTEQVIESYVKAGEIPSIPYILTHSFLKTKVNTEVLAMNNEQKSSTHISSQKF